MPRSSGLLVHALCHPRSMVSMGLADWDLLIRQARRANLLARLCVLLEERGLLDAIPPAPRNHLLSTRTLADKQAQAVRWEVDCIHRSLAKTGVPVIVLKGAAYVLAGLPFARGRLFADVDIMVPRERIDEVEKALMLSGWATTHLDAYDQRYYRQWMHELPPLKHVIRRTVLDVHHAILPDTARLHPDAAKLLDAALPLNETGDLKVLAPTDMVLHSATHLFHEGEFENGLRDIVDLDGLLRHFGAGADFWPRLAERARELDLVRPLFYGLRYTKRLLGTPIPEFMPAAADKGRPPGVMPLLMDALFSRALAPQHPSCDDWFSTTARWLLYIRSHYLRMPLHLLIPHLIRKAFRADS